ncbi:PadR family transcriptional regulator [Microlunatus flavus]|uniref:Transcriptional regulator PadR-like family protein n=1 Tax=Microlunatus flavus TaxID=1036181 RepID=A0A1H9FPY3_9ACTN|nr:PadR family transcriptional regulator [Microlunatus flavus]SEQ39869.1 Transcriptional regulator PadR-like family protein [Microlunatus flavus]
MALADLFLGLLGEGPAHGYDLKLRLDRRFEGSKPLPFAQVYATLSRLQRDGLVEVAEVSQDGGPERIVYAITDAGRTALDDWLSTTEPAGPYPAGELARKTIVALHLDSDAATFLQRQRAVHLGRMRELVQARSRTRDPSVRLGLEYAIDHLDADLRWIETAAATPVEVSRTRPAEPGGDGPLAPDGADAGKPHDPSRPDVASRGTERG